MFEQAAPHEASDRADSLCALMRLGALLGHRNGHSGVFPLGPHPEPLRFYPFRTLARPSRQRGLSLRARRPQSLSCAEVLEGVGVVAGPRASFRVRRRGAQPVEIGFEPVPAPAYVATVDGDIRLPVRRDEPRRIKRVGDGSILLGGYDETQGETESFAAAIASAAGPGVRAVILDLRRNGGGDNTTYGPLLDALCRYAAERRLFVLCSRVTFSAAMQLVVDLERRTNAVSAGEATGGSPNHFGDAVDVDLPATKLVARVATIHWQTAGEDDERPARDPDLPIPLTSTDYFEGCDPVVAGALAAVEP